MRSVLFYGIVASGLTVLLALARPRFPDRPPPAHTGGFGEPTCQHCHFDAPLNEQGGLLHVEGFPVQYTPGETYEVTVRLVRAHMQRGGFQLSARYTDGTQAGRFMLPDEAAVDTAAGITYVRPAIATSTSDSARWFFEWTVPDTAVGSIAFHASANAANGDESAFGDFIYTWEGFARSQ